MYVRLSSVFIIRHLFLENDSEEGGSELLTVYGAADIEPLVTTRRIGSPGVMLMIRDGRKFVSFLVAMHRSCVVLHSAIHPEMSVRVALEFVWSST